MRSSGELLPKENFSGMSSGRAVRGECRFLIKVQKTESAFYMADNRKTFPKVLLPQNLCKQPPQSCRLLNFLYLMMLLKIYFVRA